METLFACTYVEREIEEDKYEKGCFGNRQCTLFEHCNFVGSSLAGLLRKVGEHYGFDIDDVWVGSLDAGIIAYNRLECDDGTEPNQNELALWKAGKLRLWIADYSFHLEVRQVLPITHNHFIAEGIKTHD